MFKTSSSSKCRKCSKYIQMALKRLFFSEKKNCKNCPGPRSGNLFSRTQSSQPTTFKIVITEFLNKQIWQNAIIIAKPILTIIPSIFSNGWNKLLKLSLVAFWKIEPPRFWKFLTAPLLNVAYSRKRALLANKSTSPSSLNLFKIYAFSIAMFQMQKQHEGYQKEK